MIYISDILSYRDKNDHNTGHWIPLAKMYCEIFGRNNVTIVGGPVYEKHVAGYQYFQLPYDIVEGTGHFETLRRMIVNARVLFRECRNQTIILQYGNPFSNHIAVLLAYRKCKLYLIEYSIIGISGLLKSFVYKIIRQRTTGIICPNEVIMHKFNIHSCVVPDYIYTNNNVIVENTYSKRKYDFCVIGRITEEKGVIEVVKYLQNTKYKVLIAGKPETEAIRQELEHLQCDNVYMNLSYISESEYQSYLEASKYAILNYSGEYSNRSSGVVFDTLFNGVPVIGKKCQALAFIEKQDLGVLYNNLSDVDFDSLLKESTHCSFVNNIYAYKEKHLEYRNKLINFILS